MDHNRLSSEFLDYLRSLKENDKIEDWNYLGTTDDAFGTPGGSWKGSEGFKFKNKNSNKSYIIRSISEPKKNFIVIESYQIPGQLYNMKLSNNNVHKNENSKSSLYESYIMTAGKGRVKKQVAVNAFKKLGYNDSLIASKLDSSDDDWSKFTHSILSWSPIREEVKEEIKRNKNLKNSTLETSKPVQEENQDYSEENAHQNLNQILFGPPGTGKTFSLIERTLKIINSNSLSNSASQTEIKEKYHKLLINDYSNRKGRISFCTFHQSFTYEDFVEGIKPEISDDTDDLKYKIEDGIFKRICNLAFFEALQNNNKFELEKKLSFDDAYENLIEHLSEVETGKTDNYKFATKSGGKVTFKGLSDRGNILVSHSSNKKNYTVSKDRLRKLFNAFPDLDSVTNIYKEFSNEIGGSNATSYYAVLKDIIDRYNSNTITTREYKKYNYEDKVSIVETSSSIETKNAPPFILVIDEINRGNVASIFGELITLIEKDKRAGEENELSVILPYSKTKFTVPSNLYIIGTMNTADRSIEALDSALRRRFEFEEMLPDYDLIDEELDDKKEFEEYKLSEILKTINDRITVLINRDHQIGHSYFLKLSKSSDIEQDLRNVFMNEIIPLLQEYFFNDYTKIAMVIGEGFMDDDKYENVTFAKNAGSYNSDYDDITTYEIEKDPNFSEAIKLLMGEKEDEKTD